MTSRAEDLAARFEAKREECEKKARDARFAERTLAWTNQAEAFAEARDMARADAAGGVIDIAKALRDAYGQGYAARTVILGRYEETRDTWIKQYMARLPPPAQRGSSSSSPPGSDES